MADDEAPTEWTALGDAVRALLAALPRMLILSACAAGLAYAYGQVVAPTFTAETRLLVEIRDVPASPDAPEADEGVAGVNGQLKIIGSADLLRDVATTLNLADLPEFDGVSNQPFLDRALIGAGLMVDPAYRPADQRALEALRARLTISRVEQSRVVVLAMVSENPKLAADTANAIAQSYVAVQANAKKMASASQAEVSGPLASLVNRVASSEFLMADARIFSPAGVPTVPTWPNVSTMMIVAFGITLAGLTALTLLRDGLSRRRIAAEHRALNETIGEVAMQPVHRPGDRKPTMTARWPTAGMSVPDPRNGALSADMPTAADLSGEKVTALARWKELMEASRQADGEHNADGDPVIDADGDQQNGMDRMTSETRTRTSDAIDIDRAADRLIERGTTRAIFISPEGDEAAATSVLVARAVADSGARVLLLDMTSTAAASRPMLEGASRRGITDLLAGDAQFSDVIHEDHYSDCHVMPVGIADPVRAMRAADRLPIIMQSLTTAYDIVLIECGPADAAAIARLVTDDTDIILSRIDENDDVRAAADDLRAGGFDITVVSPVGGQSPMPPLQDRSAA